MTDSGYPTPRNLSRSALPQARSRPRFRLDEAVSQRVGRCLERQGLLEQDTESAWLDLDPVEATDAMPQILGSSVSYRIAGGQQQGRKASGFSLHAGVSCERHREKNASACAGTFLALPWPFLANRSVQPAKWFTT